MEIQCNHCKKIQNWDDTSKFYEREGPYVYHRGARCWNCDFADDFSEINAEWASEYLKAAIDKLDPVRRIQTRRELEAVLMVLETEAEL